MIALGVADLVLIAGRVLGADTAGVLDLLDVAAAEAALADAGPAGGAGPAVVGAPKRRPRAAGYVAPSAAALLHALVTRRPLRRGNDEVALVAMLQFLAVNGWDVDLDPPEATRTLLIDVGTGVLDPYDVCIWLTPRLRPRDTRTRHDDGSGPRPEFRPTRAKETPMRRWLGGRDKRGGTFMRFTPRARRVVVRAQDEARRLHHDFIGTEHILLGLLLEPEGVAGRALARCGVSTEQVRTRVEETIGRGRREPSGHIPFTPRAKKALELSLREALALGHTYVGTEHILLGLIREGQGLAAQVLVALGADHDRVRGEVTDLIAQEPPTSPDDAAAAGDVTATVEENERLRAEVERLHGLLRRHGIDPGEAESRTA
jgi:Clp amino terminal domain, pathogenicity island component